MKSRMNQVWLAVAIVLLGAGLAPRADAVSASGGNITTTNGGYVTHVWTNSATASNFVVTVGGNVEVLVVGGGGGGGGTLGGGGGGGAVVWITNATISTGTYAVVVGGGGGGGAAVDNATGTGATGTNSSLSIGTGVVAGGGGGGGHYISTVGQSGNASGGGGGGPTADGSAHTISGGNSNTTSSSNGGYTATIYASSGGTGKSQNNSAGGGGGGAGAVGGDANPANPTAAGNGGAGIQINIYSNYYWGGGGGGGSYLINGGNGGLGGGGGGSYYNTALNNGTGGTNALSPGQDGQTTVGGAGGANTGGGGGGGGYADSGGAGGSGIVIVRYVAAASGPVTYKLPMAFTNYTRAEVLTNFPVLVVFSNGLYGTFDYSKFTSPTNGGDLRFWDSTETTNLDFEIESWNTNGASYAWVRVPLLSSNTTIYAKWGTSDTTLPACTTNGAVWDASIFRGIWHMMQTNTLDSTTNANNGTGKNGITLSTAGVSGFALSLDGTDDYVDLGSGLTMGSASASLSIWFKASSTPNGSLIGKSSYRLQKGRYVINTYSGLAAAVFDGGSGGLEANTSISGYGDNRWHNIVATFNRAGNETLYIDGAEKAATSISSQSGSDMAGTDPFYIGVYGNDNGNGPKAGTYFTGFLDEGRLYRAAMSSNWVWACYANMASNAFFNGYGTVATVSAVSGAPTITNVAVTGVTTGGATFNGTLSNTGTAACAVGVLWGTDTNAWSNANWFNGGVTNSTWTNNTPFSTNITLSSGATYYYTYVASNASGVATASPPVALITGQVTVDATDNSAQYPSDTGTFRISRPPDLTNAALVVNYTTSGSTAVAGTDYTALSSSVTLNPGISNATVTVSPLRYPATPVTVVLTLSAGGYTTGTLNTATVTIQPKAPIYVTTNGTGGGTSWADATSLTNALRICTSNDGVWLAQGTYTDGATFTIASNNVAFYGGFTNGMATFGERNWTNYPAILDGQAQNRRVVTVNGAGVTLDGLVISNSAGSSAGGIIKNNAGLLTLANCRIVSNTNGPQNGVGAYFGSSAVVMMTNCTVAFNQTAVFQANGHGIYANGATLDMVDCLVNNQSPLNGSNERDGYGGGLYFNNGVLRVVRTDFLNNRKGDQGGGGAVYIGNTATTTIFSNCVFRGNTVVGGSGGALYVGAGSSYTVDVINCTFTANSNTSVGAAVYLLTGTLNLKNSILWTNRLSSGTSGSEIYQAGGTLRASYNAISGLAIPYVFLAGGSATFSNCMTNDPLFASATDLHLQSPLGRWNGSTFVTTDTAYSPCIDASDPSDPVGLELADNGNRRNLGAYGGTAQASKSPAAAPLVANRSVLTNNYTQMILRGELTNSTAVIATVGICYGTNNIVANTTNGWQYVYQFYPPQQTGTVFTVTTSFLLTNTTYYYRAFATNGYGYSWAPAESFTTVTNYPPLWGVGGGANVIHVKAGAVGEADGRDWFNAYPAIAEGVAAVGGTRTNIWIASATYQPPTTLTLGTSMTVLGGFAGTEASASSRDPISNPTLLDGQAAGRRIVTVSAGAGTTVMLDGLVITNSGGGGLSKTGAGYLIVSGCRIVNHTGVQYGSGCSLESGTVLMTNCVVDNNYSATYAARGIGIHASDVKLELVDSTISRQAHSDAARDGEGGGGLYYNAGANQRMLRVWRSEFIGNQCSRGGAVSLGNNANTDAVFSNSVFRGNLGAGMNLWPGGAVYANLASSVTSRFENCTFAYNTNSGSSGGALYVNNGTVELKNSILWTNYAGGTGHEISLSAAGRLSASYSSLTGTNSPYVLTNTSVATWGGGIIVTNPLFASATDLHLKSVAGRWNPATSDWVKDTVVSPCIDAGTGAAGSEPAPNGGIINLGAYGGTWQASKSPTPPVITNGTLVEISMNEDAGPLSLAALGLAATDQCDTAWAWTNVAGSGPGNGTVAVNGTGTNPTWTAFTYTPNTNFNGTNTFDVKVTGLTALLSDTVTVRVIVNPVSDPPANTVAPSFTGTTFEVMTQWGVHPGTWDDNVDTNAGYDGTGLTFAYQWYCSNSPSPVAIDGATSATFTPGNEWFGSNLNVQVTCSDTGYPGASSSPLNTIWKKVLAAANTPPVIRVNGVPADSVNTNMNEDGGALDLSGLGLSATDDSEGGPGVTWTNVNNPAYGTVSVNGSGTDAVSWVSFNYTPGTNFNGTDSFVVQAKDAVNATDSITVTVAVAAINDPPANTVAPGQTGTRLVGNTLTATNGVWNDNADTNGSYTAANFTSAAAFAYQWYRSANSDGSASNAIGGATASTYTLTQSDQWKYLSVAVTCTDGNYPAGSTSNTVFSAWLREASAPPVYVTTNGTGGGTSWADATSLTNALRIAPASNMIWMAQGTYADSSTFTVTTNGVTLYGGFTNGMAALAERNWTNYPTVLDGQAANRRVVTISGTNVTLDGLTIRNSSGTSAGGISKSVAGLLTLANCSIIGNTNGPAIGSGASFSGGSIVMTNCTVANNRPAAYQSYGCGIYASGVTLDLVDCTVSNNTPENAWNSRDGAGGGIYSANGTFRALRTEFIGNQPADQSSGGAAYLGAGSAAFSNCVFRGNRATSASSGAGLSIAAGSYTVSVVNCTFAHNTNAANGGAIYQSSGTLNLKNCILWTNRVNTGGSGHEIYLGGGTMNVNYCDLTGSGSPYIFGSPTFANCLYSDPLFASATDLHEKSTAGRWDPATQAFVTSDTAYSPCIDAGNPNDPVGAEPTDNVNIRINMGAYGGLAQASKSPPSVPPEMADRGYTVSYNRARISGELTNSTYCSAGVYLCYGTNSVGGDTTNGWDGVLGLGDKQNGTVFSQWTGALLPATTYYYRWFAVNNDGSNWTAAASFVSGAAAPGGAADVIHVNKDATGAGDGTSWPHAYTKIIDGVSAVSGARSNVWITAQVYSEGTRLDLGSSAAIHGGFAGTESAVAQRAGTNALGVVTNYTAINGENAHGCLNITAGNVWLDTLVCSNAPMQSGTYGGLVFSSTGALVANNCRFVGNTSAGSYAGVGVKLTGSGATVLMTNCVVANNTASYYSSSGFGIYSVGPNLTMVDCLLTNNVGLGDPFNTRHSRGAGLYFSSGTLRLVRTDVTGNSGCTGGTAGGGGMYLGNATAYALFSNCVVRGNQATYASGYSGLGGAIWADLGGLGTTVAVVNCTFAYNDNATEGQGGAIYLSKGTLLVKNSIFWTNSVRDGVSGREIYADSANSLVSVSYSDFTGTNTPHVVAANSAVVNWGSGIITNDPLYASATDLHLKSQAGRWDAGASSWVLDTEQSPCIDRGDPNDAVGSETQPNGRKINMGAYGGTVYASRTLIMGSIFRFR